MSYSMDRFSDLGSKATNTIKSAGKTTVNSVSSFGSKASNSVSSFGAKASNSVSSFGSKTANTVSSLSRKGISSVSNMTGGNTYVQLLKIVLIAGLVYLIIYLIAKTVRSSYINKINNPYIIKDTKNCKNSLTIVQDPNKEGSITLYRSDNKDGAEFTYSCWLMIDNLEYQYGKWKHVFHKGNKSSYPNRAPGVWIHPETNALRIYMNTFDDILDYIDIENLPIKKWFCLVIVLNHQYLDVYINGYLKKRKELTSLPRQNYGNLWINLFGGFEGYISRFRYFNYAIDSKKIMKIVRKGPSKSKCAETGQTPPYLDDGWWFNK